MKQKLLSQNRLLNQSLIEKLDTDLVTYLFMRQEFFNSKSVTKSVSNKKLESDLVTDFEFL